MNLVIAAIVVRIILDARNLLFLSPMIKRNNVNRYVYKIIVRKCEEYW